MLPDPNLTNNEWFDAYIVHSRGPIDPEKETFTDDFGTVIVNVHKRENCAGNHCVIHNPSDHHMRDMPLMWRNDRAQFERICEHGVGHIDLDDIGFGGHGCDGCCYEGK